VGRSDVGKTTLLEKLIPELKRRGYRVATVKHHAHPGFEIDQPGKDTWRHARAGSDHVVIAAPDKVAAIRRVDREPTLDEIVAAINDVDIILTEGYKRADKPKIEVVRAARSREPICAPDELLAIVSDVTVPFDVPRFELDDVKGLADLIEARFLR
jgi:molybdopterin-guanine dinucleotide biosynthesis protein B